MTSRLRTAAIVAVTLAAVAGAPAARADDDALTCAVDARFNLDPAISRALTTGTIGGTLSGLCSGRVDGRLLQDAPLSGAYTGTYGDGPMSRPLGGANCFQNDGHLSTEVALAVAPDRFLRYRDSGLYFTRAVRTGAATGTLGGAPLTSSMLYLPDQDCANVAITTGSVQMRFAVAGDAVAVNDAPHVGIDAPATASGIGPVSLDVRVADPDGRADLREVTGRVTDAGGRLMVSFGRDALAPVDARTLAGTIRDVKLTGQAPWTVVVSARDAAAHAVVHTASIARG